MDGVLVDLDAQMKLLLGLPQNKKYVDTPDHIHGVFRDAPPLEDSISAVHKLYDSDKYDMFIATSEPWSNPQSAVDKRYWMEKYFGEMFYKKMFITHRKDLLVGDYLIDDRPTMNGADKFKGELLDFGWNYMENKWNTFYKWEKVLDYLL